MKAKPISVVIADSQYLIRLGLRHLFEGQSRINVVDDATRSDELMEAVLEHSPDVVIFDHDKPSHFKMEDISAVKRISPHTNFLIISSDDKKESIFRVLQEGSLSFLTKECDEEEIISAVIATSKGEKFLCNKVIDVILDKHVAKEEQTCAPTNLTTRELEIVKLTAQGLSAGKVADQLYLSPHTVYTHRKNIMKKLGVNSASELIVYAINNGL
ncbi:MAG: response regulator transcription factor [Chitinophagales bacterium]